MRDGKFLATAGQDGTLRIWRSDNFEPVQVLYVDPPREWVRDLTWSGDGEYLAYATNDSTKVLETRNWNRIYSLEAPEDSSCNSVSLSHNGLLMANYGSGLEYLITGSKVGFADFWHSHILCLPWMQAKAIFVFQPIGCGESWRVSAAR